MNAATAIVIVVALLVIGAIAWAYLGQRRSTRLRAHYGPEYERTVHDTGSRRRAEAELDRRDRRVRRFNIRPLDGGERTRYADLWQKEQARFVDDPRAAVLDADRLVLEVMRVRGYPMGDFEQQAADLSVDHPFVVQEYRAAHEIALQHQRGEASTEDLRNAMIHYRALFEDLLRESPSLSEVRRSA